METPILTPTQQPQTLNPMRPNLILGRSGQMVTRDQLQNYVPPERTATHVPIHHFDLLGLVTKHLRNWHWSITEEKLAVNDKHSALMLLNIRDEMATDSFGGAHAEFETTLGFINNNTKLSRLKGYQAVTFYLCMNLQADGEETLGRKHTKHIMKDLDDSIQLFIAKIRSSQGDRISRLSHYKNTVLSKRDSDHIMMEGVREGILALKWIPKVEEQFNENPDNHPAEPNSAYLLNQAFTRVIGQRPINALSRTHKLTNLLDAKTGFRRKDDIQNVLAADTELERF